MGGRSAIFRRLYIIIRGTKATVSQEGECGMKKRSAVSTTEPGHRTLFKAMGYSDADLRGPIIGLANSWNELVPGHFNLRQVADHVRKGIYRSGGSVAEFGVIAACDGIAEGHEGMKYILPSRELIANDIEVMARAHGLDGMVLLGSCDKIVPGMLMAAARLDIPAILLPGGPMLGGAPFRGRKSDTTTVSEAVGMLKKGFIHEEEFRNLEGLCSPTCGSCSLMATANTMCALSEALGMTIPDGAGTPAVYSERLRLAEETGRAIVNLVNEGISARAILTRQSLKNAVRVLMATGGSTNAVLHLTALAAELGIASSDMMDLYEGFSRSTPNIARIRPAADGDMEDFYRAGGLPRVMKELRGLLHTECLTVTGRTVGENLDRHVERYGVNREMIRPLSDPFSKDLGLAVLRGNLAPNTAVTKPSAIDSSMLVFEGRARVFDREEEANEAILAGEIGEGTVVVIRYEGPKGGPGMREMFAAMKYLNGMGLAKKTALVTDGRFSGTNNGCFVGHVSPEAAEGGPIALLQDGDRIVIDIPAGVLRVDLPDEELKRRADGWKRPPLPECTGYLGVYGRFATSAAEGAVMRFEGP